MIKSSSISTRIEKQLVRYWRQNGHVATGLSNERSSMTARAACSFNPGFDSKYGQLLFFKIYTFVTFLLDNLLYRHSLMTSFCLHSIQ